jgi:hypothetical protein
MTEENKNNGEARKDTRTELEREGARKVRDLAKKTEEKAEKELKDRKNQ